MLSIGNCRIPRAGTVHRSEIVESHAREGSIAQESRNSTRWSTHHSGNSVIPRAGAFHRSGIVISHAQEGPPLRNRGIPRAGAVHRSEIVESHAQEPSTAQELGNLTRGNRPPLGNSEISRAVIAHRTRAVIKNLIYHNPSHTKKDVEKLNKLSCTNIQESTV